MARLAALILMVSFLMSCVTDDKTRPGPNWAATFKTIEIAPNDIIRIVTPFPEPRIVTSSTAEIKRSQHVLYLLPDGDQPITMFVTDAENESASINLTLVPKLGGLREIDFIKMAEAAIRPAAAISIDMPKIVQEPASKRPPLRRDTDDHGDNDHTGGNHHNGGNQA